MEAPRRRMLRFGDFLLDCDRCRLQRQGQPIALQPRVLEVLAYLATHAGRVVTKDELIDRVWGGEAVSDAALSRCIYAARKALGEDSRQPRFLHTAHGRGYRFAGPVETVEAGTAAPGEPVAGLPPRRRRAAIVALLAVAAALTLGVGWITVQGKVSRTAVAPARPVLRLGLLAVAAQEQSEPQQRLAASATYLLEQRLRDLPGAVVRAGGRFEALGTEASSLAEVADRGAVELLLTGSLGPDPRDRPRLQLSLHDFRPPGVPRTLQVRSGELSPLADDASLGMLAAEVAVLVPGILGAVEMEMPAAPPSLPAPTRLEALRLQLLARRWLEEGSCHVEPILEVLDQATRVDPGAAAPWLEMARVHLRLAGDCGLDPQHYEGARRCAEQARLAAPAWSAARVLHGQSLLAQGRLRDAHGLLQEWMRDRPGDPDLRFLMAKALTYGGFLGRARERLEEVVTLDPGYFAWGSEPPLPLLETGETERYLSLLPPPVNPRLSFARGLALARLDRASEAVVALASAFRLHPDHLFARLGQALSAALEDRGGEASEVLRRLLREQAVFGSGDPWVSFRLAQVAARSGLVDETLLLLEVAGSRGLACDACLRRDPWLRELRDQPRFRAAVTEARQRHLRLAGSWGLPAEEEGSRTGAATPPGSPPGGPGSLTLARAGSSGAPPRTPASGARSPPAAAARWR